MSFTVNLYKLSKRSNSTKRPSGSGTVTNCETNQPTEIMNPVLRFDLVNPFQYNYLYVQLWSRYYWIDEWTYDDGIWEASCSIDPLASWRNEIGNCTEYVLRSYYYGIGGHHDRDEGIIDEVYPMTTECITDRQLMPGWSVGSSPSGTYVIGIVSANGLTEYYAITNIAAFGAAMFSDALWNQVTADDPGRDQGGSPQFMRAQFNPLQYVTSCVWFPFSVPHANSTSSVYFGYWDSGYSAYKLTRNSFAMFSSSIILKNHPQADRGVYLNYAPYTRIKLCAGPWGDIELDTTKFMGYQRITLEAWCDPVDGTAKLYVGTDEGNDIVLTLLGQVGSPEQLSQVLKDNLASVNGAVQAGLGIGSALMGNPMGIASAVSGIGNALSAQYPDVATTGTNGARICVAPCAIWLNYAWQYVVAEDLVNNGRPCCRRFKMKDLPGYLLIRDPDVEIPATKAEIDAIKNFMKTGFFYE